MEAEEDDIIVDDLCRGAEQLSEAGLARIREVSTHEPLLLNRLITERANVSGVNVTVELPGKDPEEATEVVTKAREIVKVFEARYPEITVYTSGMVPLSNAFAEAAKGDFAKLFPMTFAAIFIMLSLLLRSISGTIAAIVVIVLSIMTGMGLTGWLGIPLSPPSSTAPVMIATLAVADDGDKLLVIFDTPRDVKGTAFLSFAHKVDADDQWLYLPALKRVKRISTSNKSGPFMGSEFACEDLISPEVEKYTYKYLKDEALNGVDCFVCERYPVDPRSGYSKQIAWVDKGKYIAHQIEFYDKKGDTMKTLHWIGYQQYEGKHWRADKMHMVNHQSGKETEIIWSNYVFTNGYTERDFDQSSLKNAR
jgi:hypothetical protein